MAELDALRSYALQTYQKSLHARAYCEISNLFSAFTFFVRGNAQRLAFELLWSKREDIAYVAAGKGYRGREAVYAFFVQRPEAMRQEKLPMLEKLYPGKAAEGMGDYQFQGLTTPHIRVARDNQTAQGAWWSPGLVAEVDQQGQLRTVLNTINYGCDFVFEDGAWKIWHLREFEEFSSPIDSAFADMTDAAAAGSTWADRELAKYAPYAPMPNVHGPAMDPVTTTRVAELLPDLAEPYETWDDSMSCVRDLGKEEA